MSFTKVSQKIARKEHIPIKNAKAELAASTRRSSRAAKRANPALKRVKG